MRKAARRLKPVRWVAEVASKADKSQSRFLPCPKSEGVRHCRRAWPPSLGCGGDFDGRSPAVTLELRSIRLEPHAELAAQSLRKILHRVLQTLHQNEPQLDHKSRFSCRVLM